MFRVLAFSIALLSVSAQSVIPLAGTCGAEQIGALALDCTQTDPCPLYLEIAEIATSGKRVFLAGNVHTDAITVHSILLASEDGGVTWAEPFHRVSMAALGQIQFLDFENGWIAGHLLSQNQPRDPFLLMTSDGGRTWRQRTLSGDSRPGRIEGFWFDARRNGRLVVDRLSGAENGMRHEVYESPTGGETWSLSQVSDRAVALPGLARHDTGWRVEPQAQSNTLALQNEIGGKWQTVARFPINAGSCKPEPPPAEKSKPNP